MTSPRHFIPRPVPVEVMGPLTPDNAEEIARWCGGQVHRLPTGVFMSLGHYLLRRPDGSYTALTPEELDEGWVEEGEFGVESLRDALARVHGAEPEDEWQHLLGLRAAVEDFFAPEAQR